MGGLNGIFHRVGDLVSYPVKATKDLVVHPKKGIKEWEHLYTHNEHEDNAMLNGLGVHGWVGHHGQETGMAVVATIFGGWAAYGAMGAGAAGGAMGGASSALAGSAGAAASGAAATGASTGAMGMATSWSAYASGSAISSAGTASAGAGLSTFGASGTAATSALASNAAAGTGALGMTTGYGAYASGTAASTMGEGVATGGSMGTGSGFAGSSVPATSGGAMTWQDYARKYNMNQSGNQQQQPRTEIKPYHGKFSGQMMNINTPEISVQAPVNNNEMNQAQPVHNNLSGSAFQNQY